MAISSMPNIYTRDIEAAIGFYRDQLGFAQTYQFPYQGRPEHVELRLGESMLALSTYKAVAEQGVQAGPGNSFELEVWCEDVNTVVAALRAVGQRVIVEPYDHVAGHRRAYVADPDGNYVVLVQ